MVYLEEYKWVMYIPIKLSEIIESILNTFDVQPDSYYFLFPSGIEINKIETMVENKVFPTIPSLAPAITSAIFLSIIRFILHYLVFQPLAKRAMKIEFTTPIDFNEEIELSKELSKKVVSNAQIDSFCENSISKIDKNSVHKYLWARKRNITVRRKIIKFVEALWRFIFYFVFVIVGYHALFVPDTASWVYNSSQNWANWPLHPMSLPLEFYYQVELGCYLHQLFWTEVSRSDAVEMILHHVTTILLIILSYLTNFTRVGAVILLLHDSADVFLESAKIFNYTSKAKGNGWAKHICDLLFVLFSCTFFITRLVIYPKFIISSVVFEAPTYFGTEWVGFWVFAGLLITLQALHIFWFYLIARMVYRLITTGIEKDERSDDESDIEEDNDDNKSKKVR